jgi:hypothetical protein
VVDVPAQHALLLVERVEAVALGEEVLERAGRRLEGIAGRLVADREASRRAVRLGALVAKSTRSPLRSMLMRAWK